MRALILIAIVVGIPLAVVAALALPRRRPASDENVTDTTVTPPDPSSPGTSPSPRTASGDPIPGSQVDRARKGKP